MDTGGDQAKASRYGTAASASGAAWPGGSWGGWAARRMRMPLRPLLDVAAPALALAQAIGRWGNYFNQELFGRPFQPALGGADHEPFPTAEHTGEVPPPIMSPTRRGRSNPRFLYESLWDLATFGLLLLIERKVKLRRGYLFAAYAALYTFGRFFTEYLRIDPAHRY